MFSTMKKFVRYYRPYLKLFFADLFCALVVSAVDLAFPLILSWIANSLLLRSRSVVLRDIGFVGLALAAMYVAKYFCQHFITSWGHIMGARMESDMRHDLFYHLQKLSFSYYDRNNTGEMLSKLISDLFDISELAHHGPENLFISLIKLVGSFVILMTINVRMTLLLLAVTLVMVVFSYFQNRKMSSVFFDNRVKIAGVNARVQDSLSGIRVVKSFSGETVEQRKFDRSNEAFLESKVDNYMIMGRYQATNAFLEGLLYIVIILSGVWFILNGGLRVGDLAVYVLYVNIYINPIDLLINFTEQFQKGYAGFKRFLEVMETQPEIEDRPGAQVLRDVKGDIAYENVSFRYGEGPEILKSIDIRIDAGRKIALVGPSGSGKTTICSLLPRFYDVTGGRVTVDGRDIRDLKQSSLRDAIGIVQQDVYLFAGSIRDNIAYGKPGASFEEIERAAKLANIHEFVESLEDGYDTYVGERGVRLSGGQKQRISIARVFLKNPPILILDEATSALDNESERYIQASLDSLAQGRTTIVIAHRLSTVRGADEILVLTDEGLMERGTHEELLEQNGLYARYYNMQQGGFELT